jgi:hypothetical protein
LPLPENPAHHLSGNAEEMSPFAPVDLPLVDQRVADPSARS